MYATLAAQAVAAIAMLMLLPAAAPTFDHPRAVAMLDAPTGPPKLRCRLYFGCTPHPKVADAQHQ